MTERPRETQEISCVLKRSIKACKQDLVTLILHWIDKTVLFQGEGGLRWVSKAFVFKHTVALKFEGDFKCL